MFFLIHRWVVFTLVCVFSCCVADGSSDGDNRANASANVAPALTTEVMSYVFQARVMDSSSFSEQTLKGIARGNFGDPDLALNATLYWGSDETSALHNKQVAYLNANVALENLEMALLTSINSPSTTYSSTFARGVVTLAKPSDSANSFWLFSDALNQLSNMRTIDGYVRARLKYEPATGWVQRLLLTGYRDRIAVDMNYFFRDTFENVVAQSARRASLYFTPTRTANRGEFLLATPFESHLMVLDELSSDKAVAVMGYDCQPKLIDDQIVLPPRCLSAYKQSASGDGPAVLGKYRVEDKMLTVALANLGLGCSADVALAMITNAIAFHAPEIFLELSQ